MSDLRDAALRQMAGMGNINPYSHPIAPWEQYPFGTPPMGDKPAFTSDDPCWIKECPSQAAPCDPDNLCARHRKNVESWRKT